MKRKYDPSHKDFMLPFLLLILGTVMMYSTLWIDISALRAILIVSGIILILYGVTRIIRIFLKIFLQEMKDWLII